MSTYATSSRLTPHFRARPVVESDSAAHVPFEESIHYRLISLALLLWFFAFMYPTVGITDTVANLRKANDSTAQGSLYNQVEIVAFALLGLIHLPAARPALRAPQARRLIFLLALYLLWCALSIFWSADASLSLRRLFSLALILVGSIGLGAGFYARAHNGSAVMARHVMYAASLCVVLLLVRIASGAQDITDPQWSLKSTAVIEPYAFCLGCAVVAVIYLFRHQPVKRLATGFLYFVLLLILKGRTLILGVISAASLLYSGLASARIMRIVTRVLACAVAVLLADLATGGHLLTQFVEQEESAIEEWLPYISIGGGLRNLVMLSGRLPLWQTLLPHAAERLWTGHGFGAFWTPDRFSEVYAAVRWSAVVAHNGFLEELLATGLVGLLLLLAFWTYGMYLSWQLGPSGYLVFSWLALFLYFNAMATIIESYYQFPTFVSFAALALVAFETSCRRCQNCSVMLLEEDTASGEPLLIHP